MLGRIPERQMRRVRWLLTLSWVLLIFSLFYDPISPWLTQPDNPLSPLRLDPDVCTGMQGTCMEEKPYAIGASIFWGAIVPSAIFILLVFGHELWRRICPLSFLSQLPRALGIQRRQTHVHPKTGKMTQETVKVKKNSWLALNHIYLQFGFFFVGLCARILAVNSARWVLGLFLLSAIVAAIAVGYLFDGKSWCQYFCPMSPIQRIYGEPRGLLTHPAYGSNRAAIPQSMCRTVNPQGQEKSACVGCQSPCIDIDAERSYWESVNQRDRKWLYYGYVGLVIGYFSYYYLYAGTWDYYLSGAWAHEEAQLANLLGPGLYLFDRAVPLPKLVAVPLILGLFCAGGYFVGCKIEKGYKAYLLRTQRSLPKELVQHRIFTLCTFFVFNFFFIFAGRNFIALLPPALQYGFNFVIGLTSTLWLYRTWRRTPELYVRESLASRLRQQVNKLNIDVAHLLEGRSLEALNPDELYVLAKILPELLDVNQQSDRHRAVLERLQKNLAAARSQTSESTISLEEIEQFLEGFNLDASLAPMFAIAIEWSAQQPESRS